MSTYTPHFQGQAAPEIFFKDGKKNSKQVWPENTGITILMLDEINLKQKLNRKDKKDTLLWSIEQWTKTIL